jgi:hypothetical protein
VRIFITGASGLIGSGLCPVLLASGHEVVALSRNLAAGGSATHVSGVRWVRGDPCEPGSWTSELAAADAVFHFAGAPVAGGRWTPERKRELVRSRIESTRVLVDALKSRGSGESGERVLLCASAAGYYGPRGEEVLTESSTAGSDFLAQLCVDWEAEAARAGQLGVRNVQLRFGVVLSKRGGALCSMLPIFKLGLGGPLGPAERWFPWVAEDDAIDLCRFALEEPLWGPLNVVSPGSCRMGEFTRTLGRTLHRPALVPAPLWALRLVLGEFADSLSPGQRVEPAAALEAGYVFRYSDLDAALEASGRDSASSLR